jgi:peroxiredoxin
MSTTDIATDEQVAQALGSIHTESGANLLALAEQSPVLLVFLRHFGCTFCRQTISQVSELRDEFDKRGVRVVFVHLGTVEIAKAHFDYYKLSEVERIHDPEAQVYQHPLFALSQESPVAQLGRAAVWKGWFKKGAIFKHGIGKIENGGHQMPGIFFLKGPQIVRKFIHRTIADEPDYLGLVA